MLSPFILRYKGVLINSCDKEHIYDSESKESIIKLIIDLQQIHTKRCKTRGVIGRND